MYTTSIIYRYTYTAVANRVLTWAGPGPWAPPRGCPVTSDQACRYIYPYIRICILLYSMQRGREGSRPLSRKPKVDDIKSLSCMVEVANVGHACELVMCIPHIGSTEDTADGHRCYEVTCQGRNGSTVARH